MALPKQYEGLEDALNVAAEIISECTGIPGTGSVAIGAIKELLGHAPIYTLKNVLNKKSAKTLNIPDDMYAFIFEQTHDILGSINSVDYNLKAFQEEIFIKNCFDPKKIGAELVKGLHINEKEESEVTKAVRFVLAVYLLHWTEEPDFSLETRQKLQQVESTVEEIDAKVKTFDNNFDEKFDEKIESLDKKYDNHEDRISKLENSTVSIPAELTMIPKPITNLIGRDSVIQEVTSKLETNHVLSITADGGLGKTAIAKMIINNIRNDIAKDDCKYKYVAWLTSSGNLKKDLSNIIIPNFASDGNETRYKKVCRFLKTYPTFLVIDNMDELPSPDEINILNTISGKSTILITSRAKIDVFPSYKLQPLDRDDAVVLFYNHYFHNPTITKITHDKIQEEKNTGRIEDTRKIVDATGGNALIIELIAKTAHADILSVTELWEKVRSGIFGFESKTEVQTDHSGKYPKSKLSIDEQMRRLYSMLKLSDKQKEIMSFISLFPAEHDIFSDVFKWAGFFDQGANDMMYLVDRGWIILEDNFYSIHTIVRDSINLQNKKSGYSVSILNYKNLIKNLSDVKKYIPKTAEYNLARKLSFVPQTVGKLLCEIFPYSMTMGEFFNNLAWLYDNQGNYNEAMKFYNIALEIKEKILSKDHASTAATYNNIAGVYRAQGNYDEALKFYNMALKIFEKTLGKNHPDTATTYNSIAAVYRAQSNYNEALKFYNMAMDIREKLFGKDHSDTATTYNDIAGVYSDQGNYDKALKFYNMALRISEEILGKNHPSTATIYNNIASIYKARGNYDDAMKFYNMALEIRELILGKGHPETAETYNNMAGVYGDQGNYDKALKFYNMSLEISEKIFGKDHPDTATTYNNIAAVYYDQGNCEDALKFYNMALKIFKKTFGIGHPFTATVYNNIADIYHAQGKYEEALKCYMIALETFEKILGVHPNTALVHENLAVLYHDMGDQEESQKHADMAKEIRKKLGDK